jgi:hypothetical protein
MVRPPGGKLMRIGIDHKSVVMRTSGHAFARTSTWNSDMGDDRRVNSRSMVATLRVVARSRRHKCCVKATEMLVLSMRPNMPARSIDAVVEYVWGM